MSTAYVSRIEAGQRRPDPALLERLAERINSTPQELLLGATHSQHAEWRVILDWADLHLATGNPDEALRLAEQVLIEAADDWHGEFVRHARQIAAHAHENSGRFDDAITILEELAETDAADLAWVRGVTALSRCYRESGDLSRAIEVGERATTVISNQGIEGLDETVALAMTVAAAYFERGDVEYAARMCRRAIAEADANSSPSAKASAYWNASIIESRRGNQESALDLAERALTLLNASNDARNLARLRTQLGILQLRQEPPEPAEAMKNLKRAEADLVAGDANPADLADNRLAQARAAFLVGEHEEARIGAQAVRSLSHGVSPLVAADACVLSGQIAGAENRLADAKHEYREAILYLSSAGADRGAAQLWFELGGLLESVGEHPEALDAYRRAAASVGLRDIRSPHQVSQ